MDPIRLLVALVALAGVGAFAFLAANSEREVDAGRPYGLLDESVTAAETRDEVDPAVLASMGAPGLATPGPLADTERGEDDQTPDFPDPADRVELTEEQWRERLTDEEFFILRESGTERPFTSPLNDVTEPGWFTCAGCDNLLYETKTKFKSGTGWPSFWAPVAANHIFEEVEGGFDRRIEVRCARCDSHLGHVFEDGPKDKTGRRHCINGVAMNFLPKPEGQAK